MVAHGCTAAGNDQVRFEVALRTLAPGLTILAPVRDRAFQRPEQLKYLEEHRLPIPPFGAAYSVNRGLWGVTIGGKETLTSAGSIPESAWVLSKDAFSEPRAPERHTIGFTAGVPSSLDGMKDSPVAIIERLETLAGPFGIGRGIHLGDTIIGTKGRVAFEAPAADILLTAHRELEKLVLTGRQARIKESVAQPYGDLVHEGQHLDPVCRDIEALLVSSQARVTGEVQVLSASGLGVRRRRELAVFADGGLERRVRRSRRRVDAGRCARVLEDAGADRECSTARRDGRGGDGLVSAAMRTVVVDKIASVTQASGSRTRSASRRRFPARKAWWWWSRSSTTSRPTTRSS